MKFYSHQWLSPVLAGLVLGVLQGCAGPGPAHEQPEEAVVREGLTGEPGAGEPAGMRMVTLANGLDEPWGMDFLPGGDLLVTEKSGALKQVDPGTGAVTDITGVPESVAPGQGGLMDVLVHPDFADNGWVYLSYTVADGKRYSTRVSRARLVDGALVDAETLYTAHPYFRERRHFGSRLLLADGYLFFTVGDRGNRDLAQRLETDNGKVIRLFEDGGIPPDNPFVGVSGARPGIWTYGHRNPQGIARHPGNGTIWVSEHGPQGGDEINALSAGTNYGWPLATYGEEYGGGPIGEGTHREGTAQPLVYWVPSIGVSNIDFYSGALYPGWEPSLLVAALKFGRIGRLQLEGDGLGTETRLLANLKMRIRDVQVGPDGRVYALAAGSRLIRLDVGS